MMEIEPMDEVWTWDGHRLGVARRWHYRPEEQVYPADLLYAAYLEVKNFEIGDVLYVPDLFIAGRDETTGHVLVEATIREVMRRTWTRTPDFIVRGQNRVVPLGESPAVAAGEPA